MLKLKRPPFPILPPRPLKLSRSHELRGRLVPNVLLAVGAVLLLGTLVYQVAEAITILDDQSLWAGGAVAIDGKIAGRRSTRRLFIHSYDLEVSYVDRSGTKHAAKTTFGTVGKPARRRTAEIRYDPKDPERFVVSWAIENARARWYSWLLVLAGGVLIAATVAAIGRKLRMRKDLLRLCAADSEEVLLDVLEYRRGSREEPASITYSVPTGGEPGTAELFFDRSKETPIYGDPRRGSILALVSRDDPAHPHVVMAGLRPFELSGQQRSEIDEKLRRLGVEIDNGRCFPVGT